MSASASWLRRARCNSSSCPSSKSAMISSFRESTTKARCWSRSSRSFAAWNFATRWSRWAATTLRRWAASCTRPDDAGGRCTMECRDIRRLAIATGVLITLVACAAPVSPSTQQSNTPAGSSTGAPQAQRTLVAAVQREPPTLALRPIGETFASQYLPNHMFNADIAVLDDQGLTHPYMVEALPQLNTDSWQVFPDGMMQTTYQFLPNLTWQDGTAFSTQDYVFAWHVYTTPALGLAHSPPFTAIDNVTAPDDRTLVIHWTRPYPDAAHMSGRDRQFPALPRHLLQAAFESQSAEAFTNLSYWTRDYVGLGPYKVVSWEPGSSIETSAFDGHATGRPKIDRIRLVFIADRNAALANALAGDVQLLADNVLQYGDAINLRQQWDPTHGGTVLWQLNTWRGIDVQARPAFVQPQALQDERIRAALFHAVDRDTLNNSIYGGVGLLMDYVMVPIGQWGPAVQQGVVPHPFDLRMSEQIMRDAGYEKGPDGFYTSPAA